MRNADFKKTLKQALHQIPYEEDHTHLEQISLRARQEVYLRKKQEPISFTYFLWKQVKFLGWKIWGAQGIFLLIINRVITGLYGDDFWKSPRVIIKLLFCISVLSAMSALPLVYRSVRYKMNEIEAAARFSSVKLLLAKLAVIGIGDVFVLIGMLVISTTKTSLHADVAAFYLSMPFLLICGGCLYMLGHFKTRYFIIGSMVFCTLLMLFFVFAPVGMNGLLSQSMSIGWLAVVLILTAFCIKQVRYILNSSYYAELQIGS